MDLPPLLLDRTTTRPLAVQLADALRAATAVFAIDLAEASVKVRSGPPSDDPADIADDVAAGGRWAGVLPVRTVFGLPETCPTLPADAPVPPHVTDRWAD